MNNHLLQDQWPINIPQNFYLLKILLLFDKALPEGRIIIWQHGQVVRALDLLSRGPKLKSCPNHSLDLLLVVLSSNRQPSL